MTEEKKKKPGISRREFLKDAGLLVGGTAIGSTVLLAACSSDGATETVTSTKTVTSTAPGSTVTTTVGAGATATETVTTTASGATSFVCPYDGQEFSSLSTLEAHLDSAHGGETAAAGATPGVVTLTVNGANHVVKVSDDDSLAFVLRDRLGMFSVKVGCNFGECGVCTVLADGVPVLACLMLAKECQGKAIETVEGMSDGITLSPIQQKFFDNDAVQCGWCTPGFLMAAKALLADNPSPSLDEVRAAMGGHICTCQNLKLTIETIAGGV